MKTNSSVVPMKKREVKKTEGDRENHWRSTTLKDEIDEKVLLLRNAGKDKVGCLIEKERKKELINSYM